MVASRFPALAQDARGFGWEFGEGVHDWGQMVRNVDTELRRLNDIYGRLLENTNCRLLRGWGTLVDAHTVAVGDETVTADRILVCTGGWPWMPQIPGIDLAITSNEVFALPERPDRVVIVGTGYIGLEFACIFQGCGAEVHLVNRRDGVLTGFDEDVRLHLRNELDKQGIGLQLGKNPIRIEAIDGGKRVHLDDGTTIDTDLVLFATGRRPRTQGIGLEALGVDLDERGAIIVNEGYQSSVPSIYAVGDVTDRVQLTPVALAEGMWLARSWFADTPPRPVEYDNIASAVFSRPNVAAVGLTEAEARDIRDSVVIYRSTFRALPHTLSGRDERSMLKLVVDGVNDRVLGAHMVGPDAGEVIQGIAIALKMGATKADFDRTIGIHPTVAEEFVTMRTPVS